MKYAEAPGTASSEAMMRPPAADSATATVSLRSFSSAPTRSACPSSFSMPASLPVCILQDTNQARLKGDFPCGAAHVHLEVEARHRRAGEMPAQPSGARAARHDLGP